jgi:hypothetical protein
VRLEGLNTLKKLIQLIGTRTRDLPACILAPPPLRYDVTGHKYLQITEGFKGPEAVSSFRRVKVRDAPDQFTYQHQAVTEGGTLSVSSHTQHSRISSLGKA